MYAHGVGEGWWCGGLSGGGGGWGGVRGACRWRVDTPSFCAVPLLEYVDSWIDCLLNILCVIYFFLASRFCSCRTDMGVVLFVAVSVLCSYVSLRNPFLEKE